EHVIERTDLMYASAGPNTAGFGVSRIAGVGRIQDAPALLQKALGGAASSNSMASSPASTLPSSGAGISPSNVSGFPSGSNNLPGLATLGNIGQLLPGLANGSVVDITQIL